MQANKLINMIYKLYNMVFQISFSAPPPPQKSIEVVKMTAHIVTKLIFPIITYYS